MIDAKTFDPYEVIGVITPGSVVALMLATQWPELRELFGQEGLSIGDLGFFVVMAFVLGHLVQALGNILESIVWGVTGMPSAWVRSPGQTLISTAQRDQLEAKVTALENTPVALVSLGRRQWGASRPGSRGGSGRPDVEPGWTLFSGLTVWPAVWPPASSSPLSGSE